jgi:hypothetical protein
MGIACGTPPGATNAETEGTIIEPVSALLDALPEVAAFSANTQAGSRISAAAATMNERYLMGDFGSMRGDKQNKSFAAFSYM